jgi:citronellol/citronellal dehydrogenase
VIVFMGFPPRLGIPNVAHGAAARAGLESLAATLACEWSQYHIRTVYLAAGAINSGHYLEHPEAVEPAARSNLVGRIAIPEEIATVVAFLTSPGAAYITGSMVVVDGGSSAWGRGSPPPAVRDD